MNEGKNTWTVGWTLDDLWKVRFDIEKHGRYTTAEEYLIYKVGWIEFWTIDWLFTIHRSKGDCISGDLTYPDGRKSSNRIILRWIDSFTEMDYPQLSRVMMDDMIYLKKLYCLTQNKMLSNFEYKQFKTMYHAIQRHEYATVNKILLGTKEIPSFEPQRILKPTKVLGGTNGNKTSK